MIVQLGDCGSKGMPLPARERCKREALAAEKDRMARRKKGEEVFSDERVAYSTQASVLREREGKR